MSVLADGGHAARSIASATGVRIRTFQKPALPRDRRPRKSWLGSSRPASHSAAGPVPSGNRSPQNSVPPRSSKRRSIPHNHPRTKSGRSKSWSKPSQDSTPQHSINCKKTHTPKFGPEPSGPLAAVPSSRLKGSSCSVISMIPAHWLVAWHWKPVCRKVSVNSTGRKSSPVCHVVWEGQIASIEAWPLR